VASTADLVDACIFLTNQGHSEEWEYHHEAFRNRNLDLSHDAFVRQRGGMGVGS
jgi:hypothetical protein